MVAVTGNKTVETTQAAPAPVQAAPAAAPAPQPGNQQVVAAIAAAIAEEDMGEDGTTSGSCPSAGCNTHGKENGNPKVYLEQRGNQNYEKVQCQCQRHCL